MILLCISNFTGSSVLCMFVAIHRRFHQDGLSSDRTFSVPCPKHHLSLAYALHPSFTPLVVYPASSLWVQVSQSMRWLSHIIQGADRVTGICIHIIMSRVGACDYRRYGLVNGFIDHLYTWLRTTSTYAIADFHNTNHYTLSLLSLLSLVISW
jgi:hypothetical protein